MKKILFISNKYPNPIDKNALVFVQQLVWQIADLGYECSVICPLSVNIYPKYLKVKYHVVEKTTNGSLINIYFPKFFGAGQSHYILGKSPIGITTKLFTLSINKTIKKNHIAFDCVYGHFVAPAGVAAARIGNKYNVPAFFAHGESTSWSIDQFGRNKLKSEFENISGVIAVSTRNKNLVISSNIVDSNKIIVFPNGYRKDRFYRCDKMLARKYFNWDKDKFIVGFCGSFDDRKGILRLEKAVDSIDDENVVFACAGKGKLIPISKKCIWKYPVNNDELVYFYNAIDVFCLPTQNEGCCNAIVEAIACGCPIISSNMDFNYDILSKDNSILINPNNVNEIKSAILKIKNDYQLRKHMSDFNIKKSRELTLEERANNILKFLNK